MSWCPKKWVKQVRGQCSVGVLCSVGVCGSVGVHGSVGVCCSVLGRPLVQSLV